MREKKEFYSYGDNHCLTVKDLAKMNGVPHEIIALRLREGWSVEKATETPAKRYKYKGERYTILELFDLPECKASLPLLYDRLEEKQWPVENALSLDSTPEPKQVKGRSMYEYEGKQYKLPDLFRMLESQVPYRTFYSRVRLHGWTIEKAASTPVLSAGDRARLAAKSRRKR